MERKFMERKIMTTKFIALPVSRGDSFYLQKDKKRILVDGGDKGNKILNFMEDICNTDYLDILICTHNDSDHAGGIITLLDGWYGNIKEVWLPGSWTYKLKKLFDGSFFKDLLEDIKKFDFKEFDFEKIEDYIEKINIEGNTGHYNCGFNIGGDNIIRDELSELIENEYYDSHEYYDLKYSMELLIIDKEKIKFFIKYIECGDRIKKIIELAYRNGCEIRFFEYSDKIDLCGNVNLSDSFLPMNSKELCRFKNKEHLSCLDFCFLTESNRKSLTFISYEMKSVPGVIFTADSDLKFLKSLPEFKNSPIITTPHHGSKNNNLIYGKINSHMNNISPIWVRSDCYSKYRPSSCFINQKIKYCTLCNNNGEKSKIEFILKGKKWTTQKAKCHCK